MKLIKIDTNENGSHDNQFTNEPIPVPEGWVIIPDDMEIPETFPFVIIEYVDGVVTKMIAGEVPPTPTPEPEEDMWDELADAIRNGVNEVE